MFCYKVKIKMHRRIICIFSLQDDKLDNSNKWYQVYYICILFTLTCTAKLIFTNWKYMYYESFLNQCVGNNSLAQACLFLSLKVLDSAQVNDSANGPLIFYSII